MTPTILPDVNVTAGAQALYDVLTQHCALPSQFRHEIETATIADVRSLLKALGYVGTNRGAKKAELDDALVALFVDPPKAVDEPGDEPEDEKPERLTGEQLKDQAKAEREAKKAAKAAAKAEKQVDPMAEWRKARYAEAEAERIRKTEARKAYDWETTNWIVDVLTRDPGAVCAREMEVYRWIEDKAIGHQAWNAFWAAAVEMLALGLVAGLAEVDEEAFPGERNLVAMVEANAVENTEGVEPGAFGMAITEA
jgi:hypothetical protein